MEKIMKPLPVYLKFYYLEQSAVATIVLNLVYLIKDKSVYRYTEATSAQKAFIVIFYLVQQLFIVCIFIRTVAVRKPEYRQTREAAALKRKQERQAE